MIARTMTTPPRAADVLVEALVQAGVKYLFTLSGNQIMSVFDATIGTGIELIHVRHEAAAVHMADAWGRLTGRPGVALVTAGPGFANTLSAMYVAAMAESPLVVFSGRSPQSRDGQGAFQEMPQAEIAGHLARASWTVTDPNRIGHDVARALRLSQAGRPGPVHVALPGDLLDEPAADAERPAVEDFHPPVSLLDRVTAERVLAMVEAAERPLVLGGPSLVRGDGPELMRQLQAAADVPVVGMGSPRGINDPSLGAFAEVLARADLLVLAGRKLDVGLRFGEAPAVSADCPIVQFDPDAAVLEQTARVLDGSDRLVATEIADPVPVLERLLQVAEAGDGEGRGDGDEWVAEVAAAVAYRPPEWNSGLSPDDGPLHPVDLARSLARLVDDADEAVFISDGGEFGQWVQAIVTADHRVINGPSGAIGGGVPFALAARLAFPDALVVAAVGDGTFGFHAIELDTAARYGLPLVVVVGNDACWNAEYQIQLEQYGPERLVGCELAATRYDELARALGGHGEHVERPDELDAALRRAGDSGLPACVNVAIDRVAAPVVRRG